MLRLRVACMDDITARREQKTVAWTLLVNETIVLFGYKVLLPENEDFVFWQCRSQGRVEFFISIINAPIYPCKYI
jgi:hypothetical protein